MLVVEHLSKSYRLADRRAVGGVGDITFEVGAAEFYTLLGPSGCGKTTILRCVAGLEEPNSGKIAISGKPMFDSARDLRVPASERGVGMVFQSYAVWPHMTVFENAAFPLRMSRTGRYSSEEISKRTLHVLATVGLAEFAQRSAHQLSGGQQQRLSLARALVSEPRLLLLDEPLSNLDAVLRDQMRVELRRLQKEAGVATLYVTHDQTEALALSDRIAVMTDGAIEQIGTPQQIYHSPSSRFVAAFVGRTNLIAGSKATGGGQSLVETKIGLIESRVGAAEQRLVTVAIRPEYVVVKSGAETSSELPRNHFQGKIVNIIFHGETIEYQISLAPGIEVTARKTPSSHESALTEVVVYFPPDRVMCLTDPGSANSMTRGSVS